MEQREQFGEEGVGAGQVIAYQRELAEWPAAAQLPRPRWTGDRSVMRTLLLGWMGRARHFGMCRAFQVLGKFHGSQIKDD